MSSRIQINLQNLHFIHRSDKPVQQALQEDSNFRIQKKESDTDPFLSSTNKSQSHEWTAISTFLDCVILRGSDFVLSLTGLEETLSLKAAFPFLLSPL